jgi:hypothetical protein
MVSISERLNQPSVLCHEKQNQRHQESMSDLQVAIIDEY